jgi:hypothetical protein
MKRMILWGLAVSLVASPALSQNRRNDGPPGYANPGAVVAEEIAFAQLAQEKGQWTAFRTTATKDAVMFVPQMVYAQVHLKDLPNPAQSVRWQPHQVWSSCDGSLAVTRGAWQNGDKSGYFTTVWQRQKNGRYKWVLDQGDELPMPLDAPDMIVSKVADCPPGYNSRRGPKVQDFKGKLPALDPARRTGQSVDGTLGWEATTSPDGARRFVVSMQVDGQRVTVQDLQAEAPSKQ